MHVKITVLASIPENREKSRNTRNPCTTPIHVLKYILLLFLERERGERKSGHLERERDERERERGREKYGERERVLAVRERMR